MNIKEFSNAVCERIGHYVYVLKDPRNSQIFYIGKGINNRIFKHIIGAIENSIETDKLNLIRDINSNNLEVEHYILRHGLTNEQAYEIESACIDLLGLENLTNEIKGRDTWERGLKSIDEVIQYYDAKIITITEPTIIININRLYKRFMNETDLYNSTRSAWKVSAHRRKNTQFAISSFRGLVREVYEIESWNINSYGDRWEFIGKVADNEIREKYINQSLQNYIRKGNQNPIRYTY